jgi:dolichyl-phosphate beta-glucosyltransferase
VTLSIVIPAYNEADRIVPTLHQSLAYLSTQEYESEIVVVSDGSTDATRRVAEGFGSSLKTRLRVLEYHPNRGKGFAVRYGMLRASGRRVLFMDADYSVPIDAVADGLERIAVGADVAIASRALPESRIQHHQNLPREWSAKLYTFIQNGYLGFRYRDTQCGFKLFTREAAQDLFARQRLDSVIFDPEILWLAKRRGYRVAEFPVTWRHIEDSRIQYDHWRKSVFIFQELFRIKALHRP